MRRLDFLVNYAIITLNGVRFLRFAAGGACVAGCADADCNTPSS